jgi:hypothetical protein
MCRGGTRLYRVPIQTRQSWTISRRVIGKAEVLGDKDNPRFIVTNLSAEGVDDDQQSPDRFRVKKCYEDFYCARGNIGNRIKEQQMDLFADRASTHWMASNQLRLWFSTFAHLIMRTLRAEVLQGTELESASMGQIRLRFLRLQLGPKRALGVSTSNSARPILSKRFSAWFTNDSAS